MNTRNESLQSTGQQSDDTMTCGPSRLLTGNGSVISSAEATHARKTVELESMTERHHLLLDLSSSALLESFARHLFSEKIHQLHEGTLPGLGIASEMPLADLTTVCCPSGSVPVALVLTMSGTACSCSVSVPTPTASGFGCKDVERMLDRRKRCKEQTGNGNGFGLTLAQHLALECHRRRPTPVASDYKGSTGKGSRRGTLAESVALEAGVSGETVYPHPAFVEDLMGFPIGWTDLDASEMP